jgi:hypothetical protein
MNIFVLDLDTNKCAKYHNNKHCIKQLLETAQLLCGVHWSTNSQHSIPYKLSHKNHPCAIWARESINNYLWLCELGLSLCEEYTYRYGKTHKSQDIIEWCFINEPNLPKHNSITPFALAMPDECKVPNIVDSYRNYYMMHKRDIANWKEREIPEWFI